MSQAQKEWALTDTLHKRTSPTHVLHMCHCATAAGRCRDFNVRSHVTAPSSLVVAREADNHRVAWSSQEPEKIFPHHIHTHTPLPSKVTNTNQCEHVVPWKIALETLLCCGPGLYSRYSKVSKPCTQGVFGTANTAQPEQPCTCPDTAPAAHVSCSHVLTQQSQCSEATTSPYKRKHSTAWQLRRRWTCCYISHTAQLICSQLLAPQTFHVLAAEAANTAQPAQVNLLT